MAVGNPARVHRLRFRPDTVARRLAEAWWDWPEAEVSARAAYLYRNPDHDQPAPGQPVVGARKSGWWRWLWRWMEPG